MPPTVSGSPRLGYLLKQAKLRYEALTTAELTALGIRPIEWAALNCFDIHPTLSQRDVADIIGVDRTKMVGLVDQLEAKGWVARKPHPHDRRRNLVHLTEEGAQLLPRASDVIDACEQQFLSGLEPSAADQLKAALEVLVS